MFRDCNTLCLWKHVLNVFVMIGSLIFRSGFTMFTNKIKIEKKSHGFYFDFLDEHLLVYESALVI